MPTSMCELNNTAFDSLLQQLCDRATHDTVVVHRIWEDVKNKVMLSRTGFVMPVLTESDNGFTVNHCLVFCFAHLLHQ